MLHLVAFDLKPLFALQLQEGITYSLYADVMTTLSWVNGESVEPDYKYLFSHLLPFNKARFKIAFGSNLGLLWLTLEMKIEFIFGLLLCEIDTHIEYLKFNF